MPDQGPSRGGYHIYRSHRGYHDTPQGGTTRTSYGGSHGPGGMYPQSSSLQPGTPRYDKAPHALLQPPMGPRPPTPRQMNLAWPSSQGSASAWNPSAGSSSHQSTRTSESHSLYNHGDFQVVRQQNPRPIPAPRPSQGSVGAVFPQVLLLSQPLTEDNRTTMAGRKQGALVVCNGHTECRICTKSYVH